MRGFLASLIHFQTTPDGDPGGGGGTPEEKPDWLLDKFKTPEEQARAYAEAERRMAQLQTQLDQERQQFAETIQSVQSTIQQPEPQYNPAQDPIVMQYAKAVEEGDAQTMLAINLQLQQRMLEQTLDQKFKALDTQFQTSTNADREMAITLATERVKGDYQDWEALAPRIGEVLQQRPHWIPPGASVEAFETTLREVADLVIAQDVKQQAAKDEADRIAKLQAQGLTGTGARQATPEQQAASWEAIKNVDLGGYAGIIRGAR